MKKMLLFMFALSVSVAQAKVIPYEIVFDDGENVLIGEVWLASGQSNMEQTLYRYEECPIENAEDEIINASSEKGIRMFLVNLIGTVELLAVPFRNDQWE